MYEKSAGEEGAGEVEVAVSLGSNLGERRAHLERGRAALERLLTDLRCSRVYETRPVGDGLEAKFLNMCCVGRATTPARELLGAFRKVERRAGRELRAGPTLRPRPLDLDLLLYGDRTVETPGLTVPHPRMADRAFVLVPLAELIPGAEVPGTGLTVDDLARRTVTDGVELLGKLEELREAEE